ncbi:MAG: hypothetical protein LAN36_09030 [Acidobacteriia bacterium]|nr:hypothetical protein [Terriglobia bacterium]
MTKLFKLLASSLLFASLLLAARPIDAQQQAAPSKVPVTTVVTVLGPIFTAPPALGKDDVIVHTGSQREDVTAWTSAQGDEAALELAIVIDDVTTLGNQLDDLRKFVRSQSKGTSVGLFYADNGMVQTVSPFSADHDAVAKKVRITIGEAGASTSIYLSLMDLIAKWKPSGARREVLLVADGIDRFRGDPASPDVTLAIEKAQKAGIMIHTLYARGVGRASRNLFRQSYGQNNLAQMTDATGGESFFQGLETPISFAPFLAQLDMVLHNQYFLTFTTARSKKAKGDLRAFRVNTEQHNVDISAAREAFVPGTK